MGVILITLPMEAVLKMRPFCERLQFDERRWHKSNKFGLSHPFTKQNNTMPSTFTLLNKTLKKHGFHTRCAPNWKSRSE